MCLSSTSTSHAMSRSSTSLLVDAFGSSCGSRLTFRSFERAPKTFVCVGSGSGVLAVARCPVTSSLPVSGSVASCCIASCPVACCCVASCVVVPWITVSPSDVAPASGLATVPGFVFACAMALSYPASALSISFSLWSSSSVNMPCFCASSSFACSASSFLYLSSW